MADRSLNLDDLQIETLDLIGPDADDMTTLAEGLGMSEMGASGCHLGYPCHCSCLASE